jgi:uncharacterized membrane protein
MNVLLWILQGVLATFFAMSGVAKTLQSKDTLAGRYPWMRDVSQTTVWFIGVTELLGAIGLIVPAVTGIAPVLTPLAAIGLASIMALVTGLHLRRKEMSGAAITVVLFALAAFVALGRWGSHGG